MDLLDIVKGPDPRRLSLIGELDASTVPALADALAARHEEPGDLYLEVSQLTFIDSMGLGALIAAAKRLGDQGNLVLSSPTDRVLRTLKLSGVAGAIPNLLVEGPAPSEPHLVDPGPPLPNSTPLAGVPKV
jgi:anti-anti-sigma factor